MNAVAERLGVGPGWTGDTMRMWVRRFHTISRLAATGGSDHDTRTYVRARLAGARPGWGSSPAQLNSTVMTDVFELFLVR
jgi:hypothetical protein